MWQKMESVIDRYASWSKAKKNSTLRLWRSIWNRSQPWISALHLYPSTPRSSSDNFSLTLHFTKRVRNLTLLILGASSLIFIFPPSAKLDWFFPTREPLFVEHNGGNPGYDQIRVAAKLKKCKNNIPLKNYELYFRKHHHQNRVGETVFPRVNRVMKMIIAPKNALGWSSHFLLKAVM